ncbi:type IV secretion system protein VirB10 [Rhizobiales bacterium GAS113]|nr:type IV secretion system protein VirB10 [Rhizobiales bacterium GAS113]
MADIDYDQLDGGNRGELPKRHSLRIGRLGAAAFVGVTLIALGYALYLDLARRPEVKDANESFNTAQINQDLNWRQPPAHVENRLKFEPPPAPAPAPVVQKTDDDEARRRAEEERLRREAEAREQARLRSPMMVLDAGDKNAPPQSEIAKVMASGPEEDANRRFANQVSNTGVEISKAEKIQRIDALVPQGTMIRGALETAIQSDLPGMVRAITSEDVYSFDGRRVLIPKGTMLTGEYRSGLARGQTRVLIIWTRVLRADGVSLALGSYGTDDLGRSGLTGDVDRHYLERFGSAILLTMVGGASQYVVGLGQKNQSNGQQTQTSFTDPVTGRVVTTTTQPNSSQNNGQQIAAQAVGNTMNQIAQEALKDSINIAPTVYVDQGTPIMVFVRRDLDFSALYMDPVKEALIALKHPGPARPAPPSRPRQPSSPDRSTSRERAELRRGTSASLDGAARRRCAACRAGAGRSGGAHEGMK